MPAIVFSRFGVTIYEDGSMSIAVGDMSRHGTPEFFEESAREAFDLKWKVHDLERQVNARQPHRFIPKLLEELAEAEKEMRAVGSGTGAGLLARGQAQGIRESIERVKAALPDLEEYRQW